MKASIVVELEIGGETEVATLDQVTKVVESVLPGAGNTTVTALRVTWEKRP